MLDKVRPNRHQNKEVALGCGLLLCFCTACLDMALGGSGKNQKK